MAPEAALPQAPSSWEGPIRGAVTLIRREASLLRRHRRDTWARDTWGRVIVGTPGVASFLGPPNE